MIRQKFHVAHINQVYNKGERALFEKPKDSRRKGDNPAIGHSVRNIAGDCYSELEGTADSGYAAITRVHALKLHDEKYGDWKRITEKRAEQFREEMTQLEGKEIFIEQNAGYKPDYAHLQRILEL